MKKSRNVILSVLVIGALLGMASMGCDEDVCSEWDLDQCDDAYDDCLADLEIDVSDAGVDATENCVLDYCRCLDREGCDFNALPACEDY